MIKQNEQIENVTFQALAHPTRRTIIRIVESRNQGVSYTELLTELGMSTGKLNYHLEQLKGIIEKNSNQRYVLTPFRQRRLSSILILSSRRLVQKTRNMLKLPSYPKKQAFNP